MLESEESESELEEASSEFRSSCQFLKEIFSCLNHQTEASEESKEWSSLAGHRSILVRDQSMTTMLVFENSNEWELSAGTDQYVLRDQAVTTMNR